MVDMKGLEDVGIGVHNYKESIEIFFLKKFLPWKVNNICYTLDFIDDAVLCQTEDKKY